MPSAFFRNLKLKPARLLGSEARQGLIQRSRQLASLATVGGMVGLVCPLFSSTLSWSAASEAWESTLPSCWEDGPVVDLTAEVSFGGGRVSFSSENGVGPVRLPLAPWKPDVLTEARILWVWMPSTGSVPNGAPHEDGLTVSLSFPDPKPLGLPYTLQGFAFETSDGVWVRDWSGHCESAGVSVFPHQSWSEQVSLPDELSATTRPLRIRVRAWGSRN